MVYIIMKQITGVITKNDHPTLLLYRAPILYCTSFSSDLNFD